MEITIGNVLRASSTGYVCGVHSNNYGKAAFGAFVSATDATHTNINIIGLIQAIRIDDDPLARQLVMSGKTDRSALRDQRENRLIPVEMEIVNIGYFQDNTCIHNLPPRPPLILDTVQLTSQALIYSFTSKFEYFRPLLFSGIANSEALIAAAIRTSANIRPTNSRYAYLVATGRMLSNLLGNDLPRLKHLLSLINPNTYQT